MPTDPETETVTNVLSELNDELRQPDPAIWYVRNLARKLTALLSSSAVVVPSVCRTVPGCRCPAEECTGHPMLSPYCELCDVVRVSAGTSAELEGGQR